MHITGGATEKLVKTTGCRTISYFGVETISNGSCTCTLYTL